MPDEAAAQPEDLVAWRDPEPALRARNLALAYLNAGVSGRSPTQMVRGYRMLTEVQKSAPGDIGVLKGIGRALLLGKEPLEALKAFERVLRLDPNNAGSEEDVGIACLGVRPGGESRLAFGTGARVGSSPAIGSDGTPAVYQRQGDNEKAAALGIECGAQCRARR